MADLDSFARDVAAIEDGAWEKPGPEWGDMELLTRGFGDLYEDTLARAQAEEVRKARADGRLKPREGWDDVKLSDRIALANKVALDTLFIDVRNLTRKGVPVPAAEYRKLALTPEHRRLASAVFAAAEIVATRKAAVREDAAGN